LPLQTVCASELISSKKELGKFSESDGSQSSISLLFICEKCLKILNLNVRGSLNPPLSTNTVKDEDGRNKFNLRSTN